MAQTAQHFQSVHAGQRKVEDHDVVVFGAQRLIGMVAAAEHVEHEARLAQCPPDPFGEIGMVLDQQPPHRGLR